MEELKGFDNLDILDSPIITLHGKPLKFDESLLSTPRTPKTFTFTSKKSIRSSPRSSPRRIYSRLPIRTGQSIPKFILKDLRLPPDDNFSNEPMVKVTPEKLMEELRVEVKRKLDRSISENEENISDRSFNNFIETENYQKSPSNSVSDRPRMSLRNRCPIILDAPDLIYEDPLEIARQTFQNTRENSGYRHIKLIYTTERRDGGERELSPEPAFSKKTGITRHLLSEEESGVDNGKTIKFDRILTLFEGEEEFEISPSNSVIPPLKSCLKRTLPANPQSSQLPCPKIRIVHIKRVCYEDDICEPIKVKRKLGNNGTAKRLKKND